MTTFSFAGNDFSDIVEVEKVAVPVMPSIERTLKSVPGKDGALLQDSRFGTRKLVLTVRVNAGSREPADIAAAWAEIAPLLYHDNPKRLDIGDGRYYMAVLTGETEIETHAYYGTVELSFECPDAFASGADVTSIFPATIHAGGNYPSKPVIRCQNAVRSEQSGVWGVRIDDGEHVHVAMPSGTHSVEIDCDARTVTLDGATAMITLDSDWIEIGPGEHVLTVDQGSGSGTIGWTERWL